MVTNETDELPTRERILREASRLFAIKGYHGTSTREIAEAVEIRQPSLFHHFPSKATIMGELIDASNDEAAAVARQQASADGSAALRLYRYLVWDIAYICRCPYDLTSVESVLSDPAFLGKTAGHRALIEARRSMIEEAIESGEFVDVDADLAEKAVVWIVRGDIADTAGRVAPDAGRIATQLASFVLRALLRDPSQLDSIKAQVGDAVG
ncbi:MAG: TetR/AcrR family transcriptional regulator [Acidimicrobiia bacterium]|nr:TetR/AcrR family transcriptional regulator [Acidimicrobiia bacterium]